MFEHLEEAKRQILRDKHTLLEGYVTEYLFEQQFLIEQKADYTNGWWSALKGGQRFFFLVKEEMNNLDKKVFDMLSSQHICWAAYPKGKEWFFFNRTDELCEKDFLDKYKIAEARDKLAATNDIKNPERQSRCIKFFEEHNLIKKIAVERNFADDFLTAYFNSTVNIDYITINSSGHLCAMEVKFKFENKAGYFGINAGQMSMFKDLEELGFEIHHMILYNHTKDKELSIFGFLNMRSLEKYWLYSRLADFSNRKKSTAPEETSVDGKTRQAYYLFGMNEISKKYSLRQ